MAGSDCLLYLTHVGRTIEDCRANSMLRDAVERCLERVSEASRRIPDAAKASQPQIPWRKVADIDNVLRHEYDDAADSEAWRIVVYDLGALRSAIDAMIRAA